MDTVFDTLAAWLATYALHSTLLLGGVWLLLRLRRVPGHLARQSLWRTALVGSLITATLQSVAGVPTLGGEWTLPATTPPSPTQEAERRLPADHDLVDAGFAGDPWVERRTLEAGEGWVAAEGAWPAASLEPRVSPAGTDRLVLPAAPPAGREPATTTADVARRWMSWLVTAWLVLALGCLARLGLRRWALARRLSDRRPVQDRVLAAALDDLRRRAGFAGRVRLTVSERLTVPAALGRDEICLAAPWTS